MPPKTKKQGLQKPATLTSGLTSLAEDLNLNENTARRSSRKPLNKVISKPDVRKTKLVKPKADPFRIAKRYTQPGEVFVVGSGECGQLGLGEDVLEKLKPAKLDKDACFGGNVIVAVFAGGMHNIALTIDGKLFSWGCNDQFALGRHTKDAEETVPMQVEGLDHEFIVDVDLGDSISVALTTTGSVYAWGTFRGSNGTFGFRPNIEIQETPMRIEELKDIVEIKCGSNHVVCLDKDGKVFTWGAAEQGQLGRKVMGRRLKEMALTPRSINVPNSNHTFSHIYCGNYHTFFLKKSNSGRELWACGLNNYGQLGNGEMDVEEHSGLEWVDFNKG
ncbi:Regulator of chromosome condensation, partial [Nowakowskiella sp. JEL0078]